MKIRYSAKGTYKKELKIEEEIEVPIGELVGKAKDLDKYLEKEGLKIGSDGNGLYSIYSISKSKFVCIPNSFLYSYELGCEMDIIGKTRKDLEILAEFIRLPFEKNKITKYATRKSERN